VVGLIERGSDPLAAPYTYTYIENVGYHEAVPNKTIYVADADLPLFQRAQELTGDNLSATIVRALRRLVEIEEGRTEGFEEITVRVGTGTGRRQRFVGVMLVEWRRSTGEREETYRVYRSRSEKYVLHLKRSSESIWTAGADGQATGWRKHVASDQQWGTLPRTASLQVFEDLDSLREHVPHELYTLIEAAAGQPVIEDLDI
jgi:EXLDI family protein